MIEVREATKNQAAEIARLIMMAMTDECCLYYCADGCSLRAFHKMMTYLVNREDSQYSYRNTLVAMDGEKADAMHLPCVGLLVDKDNPDGEALYASVGFRYVNDSRWGGHEMKHLIL